MKPEQLATSFLNASPDPKSRVRSDSATSGTGITRPRLAELQIDRSRKSRSRLAPAWYGIFMIVIGGGFALYVVGEKYDLAVVQAATVQPVSTEAAPHATVLDASGYVVARRKATVSSKVTGKLLEVLVEEGMKVERDQVLARLDAEIAEKSLKVAESELQVQRGFLEETRTRLKEAQARLDRTATLRGRGFVSAAELDERTAKANSLKAQLRRRTEEEFLAQQKLQLRKQDLDDLVIRAPFSGVAVSKDAQAGEMVSPISAGGGFTRTGICTIVDMHSLEIGVDVNESYISRVFPGQPVLAKLDAYPSWQIPASVIAVVPTADRQKATVRVRIAIGAFNPRILPDMGVKVSFQDSTSTPKAAPQGSIAAIPAIAMRSEANQEVVFVIRDGHVERRAIRVATAAGDAGDVLPVLSGLSPGERVVIAGPPDLRDGMKVQEK